MRRLLCLLILGSLSCAARVNPCGGPLLGDCFMKFCFTNGKPSTSCLQCPNKGDCCNKKKAPVPTSRGPR